MFDKVKNINKNFEDSTDAHLLAWKGSPVSGWIACGLVVVLLAIGLFLGKLF